MAQEFFRDKLILVSVAAAVLLNIIIWIILAGKFAGLPPTVPLHFNVVYGIDYVGKSSQIFELSLTGTAILAVNVLLGKVVFEAEKMWSYLFVFAAAAAQVFLLIAGISIVTLNG